MLCTPAAVSRLQLSDARRRCGLQYSWNMRSRETTSTEARVNEAFGTRTRLCRRLAVLCFLAAFSLDGTSPPPVEIADSLEWMTWDSDLVVLGYPRKVEPDVARTNDSMFEEQVTIDVRRVLYGSYDSDSLSFRWETNRAKSMKGEVDITREPNVKYDRPQLFFLRHWSDQDAGNHPILWSLRSNVFPTSSSQGLPTTTGDFAKTADEILRIVEEESSSRATTALGMDVGRGPDNFSRSETLAQDCFGCIARKGAVILRVSPTLNVVAPAYARFQEQALDLCQSEEFKERERGAFMLRSYPGEVARGVLTSLLRDAGAYRWTMSATTECATYLVRAAAYDVLRDQGIVVPKPLLDDCHNR